MKYSKSILLFTSLFLLVSCGRSRFPNNDNNENNDNNNNDNNNNNDSNNDETTGNIDNEDLIKKLQEGYVANVTSKCLDIEGMSGEAISFFGSGVCGIEGVNYVKGDNGDAYYKTLDLQNNITYEPMNMLYDETFINGYRLLENYKFENYELVIDDPKIQSTLFYSTVMMPCDMYGTRLIMEKAVLQNNFGKNPLLCLELLLNQGENEWRSFRVTAEYISFDYSDYLIEKLPTLPEQDRIGKTLDQLRSLDSYTIHLATDDVMLYITQNALLIQNTHLNGSEDVFDSYYIPKDDYIMQYIIKDGSIVDTYSCHVERSQLRPSFGFAKEVFLQEADNQYIFHPKVNSSEYLHDLAGFLPLIYDSYKYRTLDKLKLFTDKEDYFYVHDSEGLFLEYYNYNCTSIPQEYIDLVNSYNPTVN